MVLRGVSILSQMDCISGATQILRIVGSFDNIKIYVDEAWMFEEKYENLMLLIWSCKESINIDWWSFMFVSFRMVNSLRYPVYNRDEIETQNQLFMNCPLCYCLRSHVIFIVDFKDYFDQFNYFRL